MASTSPLLFSFFTPSCQCKGISVAFSFAASNSFSLGHLLLSETTPSPDSHLLAAPPPHTVLLTWQRYCLSANEVPDSSKRTSIIGFDLQATLLTSLLSTLAAPRNSSHVIASLANALLRAALVTPTSFFSKHSLGRWTMIATGAATTGTTTAFDSDASFASVS